MNPNIPQPKSPKTSGESIDNEEEREAASRRRMLQLFQERYELSEEQAECKMREFQERYRL
jgi:hypothetical protein